MAEGRKKKTASTANSGDEVQRPVPTTSGEILRAARMAKGLGLEEISSVIHIRVGQLRAIEEGNLAALPGMTYALGFVKSYANYLKVNSAEVVQKFKAEHGAAPAANASSQNFHLPEPIPEGPQPNLFILGIAGACIAVVVAAWAIFSGGDDKAAEVAAQIPPAPAVGTVSGITQTPATPAATTNGNILGAAPAPAVETQTAAPEAPVQASTETPPAMPATAAPAVPGPEAAPAAPDATAAVAAAPAEDLSKVLLPLRPDRAPRPAKVAEAVQPEPQAEAPQPAQAKAAPAEEEQQPVIKIKRGKGRIVLVPTQSSWVEIRDDESDESVLKRVLRPGDQFYVPDRPGLTLLTSNAGGLDVYVDGAKVQSLGKAGEIVRGVELNPDELKISKIKSRDRR